MKKLTTLVFVSLMQILAINTVMANEESDSARATDVELANIVKLCKQDAKDDEIEANVLNDYLTLCINDELNANDFLQLTQEQAAQLLK